MRKVSKQVFLSAVTCPTLGWLVRSGQIVDTPTSADRLRMEQGIEIGRRARELYPQGILVGEPDIASAAEKTRSLMNDPNVSVIFEGTFSEDGYSTKGDILRRTPEGWHLVEVKASANDKDEFIDDMAYTAMVILRSGTVISGVSILLVSKEFRLGMDNEKLFAEIDHTQDVMRRVEEFKPLWEQIDELTSRGEKPAAELRFDCRKCETFRECLGQGIENHVFEIPRLSPPKFEKLKELGIVSIEDIPDDFELTDNQKRVSDSVRSNAPFIGDDLGSELQPISKPCYYLDFESLMTAIPLYEGVAPFTQIPTQYSIHRCESPGEITDHSEYIANPHKDCRRELAERLIRDLADEGNIVVYTHFEKRMINALISEYPYLRNDLQALASRLVDLEAIIRGNYYHPGFHGSTSIKKTLPVLVPGMSYDGLEIADGDSASAEFAFCVLGKYDDQKVESIKEQLLTYCKQDTLAMVKLHERLLALV
ncbi:MAG: DUF2779 domain-containing protein [Desulfobacteraceae bacterium]|nr:DUF2779 domain-containing protein [Desulfobacteraceae bacterium]